MDQESPVNIEKAEMARTLLLEGVFRPINVALQQLALGNPADQSAILELKRALYNAQHSPVLQAMEVATGQTQNISSVRHTSKRLVRLLNGCDHLPVVQLSILMAATFGYEIGMATQITISADDRIAALERHNKENERQTAAKRGQLEKMQADMDKVKKVFDVEQKKNSNDTVTQLILRTAASTGKDPETIKGYRTANWDAGKYESKSTKRKKSKTCNGKS